MAYFGFLAYSQKIGNTNNFRKALGPGTPSGVQNMQL
jgi:hypothetical protein